MSELTEAKRDRILNKIIQAYAANPNLSSLELRDVNARIAKQERVGHMVVAGVASNFTRGAYGNPTTLIRNARRALNTKSRAAAA